MAAARTGNRILYTAIDGYLFMMTYYDHKLGRERVKRRYTWAIWSFCGGLAFGFIVAHLL